MILTFREKENIEQFELIWFCAQLLLHPQMHIFTYIISNEHKIPN